MIELDIGASVLWSLAGLYAILLIASSVVALLSWRDPAKDRAELVKRIRSWWIIVTVFTLAMVLSRNVAVGFFAVVSFLALKEFLSIIPTRRADRRVLFWAYLAIPLQYCWGAAAWYGMFIIFGISE